MNYHHYSIREIFEKIKTSPQGLSAQEVQNRQKIHGPNVLPRKKGASQIGLFFSQFKSSLVYILLIAGVVSFSLGEVIDSYVIFAAVSLNVIVGYIQESRAQKSLEALKKVITFKANVIRQGKEHEIEASRLVPGDILVIRAGDKIAADARLIEATDLTINESSLTGESEPRHKNTIKLAEKTTLAERGNTVYMGTMAVSGVGRAVVTATGLATEIGQIAELLKKTREEVTPLQKKLGAFSRWLALVVLGMSTGLFVFGLLLGYSFIEIFEISIAVAVAAIPEGLVVEVTIILAVGMQQILKRKGLVRKLVAAETLGSTTVICTDKTGTLTEGRMKVTKIMTWDKDFVVPTSDKEKKSSALKSGSEFLRALQIGVLCNDAVIRNPEADFVDWVVIGNSTERALLVAGRLVGLDQNELLAKEPRIKEIPFDSRQKYMMALHHHDDRHDIFYIKGAPEKLLAHTTHVFTGQKESPINGAQKSQLIEKYEQMSQKGLRVLAVGYKKVKKGTTLPRELPEDIVWVGFMGIEDPLRPEAKDTIKLCQRAGIRVVMITGDNKLTAQSIARKLGLKVTLQNILEGEEMDHLSDEELRRKVLDITVYARVSPRDKLRIVDAWQARGEVVAMTGDGVNDAPALKTADIGVALGSGTEVAKETASLVLLDDNFSTIVSAVEKGRVIFENLRKVTLYLLSNSFAELIIIVVAMALGMPLPILAVQVLWINLINDSLPNIALALDPEEKGIMNEKPRDPKTPILNTEMKTLIILITVVTGLANFARFYFFWKITGDLDLARTVVFTSIALDSLLYVFSTRSLRHNIWQGKVFANRYLVLASFGGLVLQLLAIYLPSLQNILRTKPLGALEWAGILGISLLVIVAIELTKHIFIVRKIGQKS